MRLVLMLSIAACTPAPRPPIDGHVAAQSRRQLAGYPVPVEPASVDCAIEGAWEYGQPDALRFRDGGAVYASVIEPKHARIELAGTTAFVELVTPGVRVWGYVDHDNVALHPARAFVVADYLAPGPHAILHAVDATARGVSVSIVAPSFVKPSVPPRGQRPCSDLALTEGSFAARATVGTAAPTNDALASGVAIPLSTTVGAPPVAELHFDENAPADVLERRGDSARVVISVYPDPGADTLVVGWVPQSVVHPDASGHAISDSRGGGRGGARGRPRGSRPVTCTHEVPLVAEVAGERHLVGAIAPSVVIGEVADAGDSVEVTIDRAGMRLADGARWLAAHAALRDCHPTP